MESGKVVKEAAAVAVVLVATAVVVVVVVVVVSTLHLLYHYGNLKRFKMEIPVKFHKKKNPKKRKRD